MANITPHCVAQKGFNINMSNYESARPSYPDEVIEHLKSNLKLVPNESHILDLAAGTGKMTRLLSKYDYKITAIEPSEAMRNEFQKILPNITCLDGTAWAIPLPDQSQDAVVIAQAFHWFADVMALREVKRVLKKGGMLALVWNMEDKAKQWVADLRTIYEKYDEGVPQYRLGLWKKAFEDPDISSLFTPLQHAKFHFDMLNTRENVWKRVVSKSFIAILDTETQNDVMKRVFETVDNAKDMEFDKDTGLIKYPYETDVYICSRVD